MAVNEASRACNHHRSKSQRRPHLSEKYHYNQREHRDGHGSRIQGRSQSHSLAKTLVEIGIGIGIAVVVGVASLARGRSNAGQQRHGCADSHKDNARRGFKCRTSILEYRLAGIEAAGPV